MLLLCGAAEAQVQDPEPIGDETADRTLALGLTAAKIDEDWFARLTLAFNLRVRDLTIARQGKVFERDQTHDLRIGLYAPLTLLFYDNRPKYDENRFRTEEWDEAGDWAHILRSIEYGHPYDGVYLRGGELANVNIGHRTIVSNYGNGLAIDHAEWGVHGALNTVYGGTELLLDDVTDPEVGGLRIYARPGAFVNPASFGARVAVGMSVVGDFAAPVRLEVLRDGTYRQDGQNEFVVDAARPTGVLGWDAELQAVRGQRGSITPYTDLNAHLGFGTGWHIGTFWAAKPIEQLVIDGRIEYRLLGSGYLPTYFGSLYEIERYAYRAPADSPARVTRLRWLQLGEDRGVRHGAAAELGLNIGNAIRLDGGWEDHSGRGNARGWIHAAVTGFEFLQLGAWYTHANVQGAEGFFDLGGAMVIAELRVRTVKWLYVTGQTNRRWMFDGEGAYVPVDDFAFGLSAVLGF